MTSLKAYLLRQRRAAAVAQCRLKYLAPSGYLCISLTAFAFVIVAARDVQRTQSLKLIGKPSLTASVYVPPPFARLNNSDPFSSA